MFVIGSDFCFVQPNRREEMAMTAIVKASNFNISGFSWAFSPSVPIERLTSIPFRYVQHITP